jgi:hypothetical protein
MAKTNFIGNNKITIRANFSTADSINMTLIMNTICKKMSKEFKTSYHIKPKAYIYYNAKTIILYDADNLTENTFDSIIVSILEKLTEIELDFGDDNKKSKYWAEYIVECSNGENYYIEPDKYKKDDNNE